MDKTEVVWAKIILGNDKQTNYFAQDFQEHSRTGFD